MAMNYFARSQTDLQAEPQKLQSLSCDDDIGEDLAVGFLLETGIIAFDSRKDEYSSGCFRTGKSPNIDRDFQAAFCKTPF